jgi:hypothetical protein
MGLTVKTNTDKLNRLEIKIDGYWSSQHFIRCLKAVEFLYYYYTFMEVSPEILQREAGVIYTDISQKGSTRLAKSFFGAHSLLFNEDLFDPFQKDVYMSSFVNLDSQITLKRIQYSSPGSIDFIGVGKVFETIKEVIFHYFPNKSKQLENKLKEIEITDKEIEVLKKLGLNKIEIQSIILKRDLSKNAIKTLIEDGAIKEVSRN